MPEEKKLTEKSLSTSLSHSLSSQMLEIFAPKLHKKTDQDETERKQKIYFTDYRENTPSEKTCTHKKILLKN